MTFKVMIADDEPIIKNGLLSFINWRKLDCEVVSTVDNGLQAKQEVDSKDIDIIVADIRMPGINGIELAEYVHEYSPHTKVIILTGYAYFSYAQSAIKYDVVDFVIKSNPIDKIQEAVTKATLLIKQEREKEKLVYHLKKSIHKNLRNVQSKFLLDLIHRVEVNRDAILDKAQEFHISIENYYVLLFQLHHVSEKDSSQYEETNRILHSIDRLFKLSFQQFKPYLMFLDHEKLCAICSLPAQGESSNIEKLIEDFKYALTVSSIPRDYEIRIGTSERHESILDVADAYQQALRSLVALNIESALQTTDKSYNHTIMDKIILYIHEHYHEKISLEFLADYVHMNSSYLSRLFKKEIGEPLTDYVNRLRIEKAKELIENNELNINEISFKIGFSDPSYFSVMFKKFTGYSPRDYKNKL